MFSETAIRVHNLGKCYRIFERPEDRLKQALWRGRKQFFREFWALKDVSFEVKKGETLGIVGRNGSGKSTLLQLICGTATPTAGEIEIHGRIAALLELGSGFNPEFTGRENVFMNAAVLGLSRQETQSRFESIASFADIGDFIEQPVKTYSSGMQMRLAFAVAVNVTPELLVIDEALSVGDMAFQQRCYQRLRQMKEEGVTVLLVSHDIMLVRQYCDRAIYLQRGRLKMQGDPEVVGEEYVRDMRLEDQPALGLSAVQRRAQALAAPIASYGTPLGAVKDVRVYRGGMEAAVFDYGDAVEMAVEAWCAPSVANPKITMQLRDTRGYVVYGTDTLMQGLRLPRPACDGLLRVIFRFPARLGQGMYAFTVGLTDHTGDTVVTILDKVVGVCPITVRTPAGTFYGAADIGASCSLAGVSSAVCPGNT